MTDADPNLELLARSTDPLVRALVDNPLVFDEIRERAHEIAGAMLSPGRAATSVTLLMKTQRRWGEGVLPVLWFHWLDLAVRHVHRHPGTELADLFPQHAQSVPAAHCYRAIDFACHDRTKDALGYLGGLSLEDSAIVYQTSALLALAASHALKDPREH